MDNENTHGWVVLCSERLQRQWPTIDPTRLDDLAWDLSRDRELRSMAPEAAAVTWLRRGIPTVA